MKNILNVADMKYCEKMQQDDINEQNGHWMAVGYPTECGLGNPSSPLTDEGHNGATGRGHMNGG